MNRLGMELKRLRIENGLSQLKVAESINYSDQHIRYLESGKRMPSFALMKKLADVYKVSLDHFGKFI